MLIIDNQQFQQLVDEAWEQIPSKFRDQMENVFIQVEENPRRHHLRDAKVKGTLLGLFSGVPKTAWGQAVIGVQPSKITLFRNPILRQCRTIPQLKKTIKKVLMHEIAHYFGYSEDDMKILDKKLDS